MLAGTRVRMPQPPLAAARSRGSGMLAGTRARPSTQHPPPTAYLFLPFSTFGCTSSIAEANSSTSPNSRYTDAKRT